MGDTNPWLTLAYHTGYMCSVEVGSDMGSPDVLSHLDALAAWVSKRSKVGGRAAASPWGAPGNLQEKSLVCVGQGSRRGEAHAGACTQGKSRLVSKGRRPSCLQRRMRLVAAHEDQMHMVCSQALLCHALLP